MSPDLTLLHVGNAPAAGLTEALTSAAGYALSEKAEATRRAYRADIRRFSTWCETVGAIALPATPATVAAYLAALANRRLKVSTISRRAAAIAYAHKLAGFEPPINESVKAVMRGIRRKLGTAQKGKAPATAAIVAKLVKRVPDDLSGKRDKALILIGFAAALRRSELVALTVADVERAGDGVVLHIRRSKTDQEGQGALPNGRKLQPVEALDAWLEAAAITEGSILRRVMKGGRLGHALTTQSVALVPRGQS
jgi:site-specific recombinase XerD